MLIFSAVFCLFLFSVGFQLVINDICIKMKINPISHAFASSLSLLLPGSNW